MTRVSQHHIRTKLFSVSVKKLYPKVRINLMLTALQVQSIESVNIYFPDYDEGTFPPHDFFFGVSALKALHSVTDCRNSLERLAAGSNQGPTEEETRQ